MGYMGNLLQKKPKPYSIYFSGWAAAFMITTGDAMRQGPA